MTSFERMRARPLRDLDATEHARYLLHALLPAQRADSMRVLAPSLNLVTRRCWCPWAATCADE